jgi:hypothetical protein
VASEPQAPPPPDAVEAPETQQAASPDATSPDVVDEAQEQTAPPETATEIVTEAEQPAGTGAPTTSLRPQARPSRVAAQQPQEAPAQPEVNETPDEDPVADALTAALQEALSAEPEPDPAAQAEGIQNATNIISTAVSNEWVVDVGSTWVYAVIDVGFTLGPDRKVVPDSIRLEGSQGGTARDVEVAFQVARRAILTASGREGFGLDAEDYDLWREVILTFNPEEMRLR